MTKAITKMRPAQTAMTPARIDFGAKAWTYRPFLHSVKGSRQRARPQQNRKIVRTLRRKIAADLALTTKNRLPDDRYADHLERFADMMRADIGKAFGSNTVEPEIHNPLSRPGVLPCARFRQIRAIDFDVPEAFGTLLSGAIKSPAKIIYDDLLTGRQGPPLKWCAQKFSEARAAVLIWLCSRRNNRLKEQAFSRR